MATGCWPSSSWDSQLQPQPPGAWQSQAPTLVPTQRQQVTAVLVRPQLPPRPSEQDTTSCSAVSAQVNTDSTLSLGSSEPGDFCVALRASAPQQSTTSGLAAGPSGSGAAHAASIPLPLALASAVPPCSSKLLQPKFLKQINALNTKQELLDYVERCHHLLDPINLVTCLYRLARNYSFMTTSAEKLAWRHNLFQHPAFTLLLSTINQHLLQAQALVASHADVPGLNARCIANLVWALVKLEVTADDGHPLAMHMIKSTSPLVMCFLQECSGQGLSNLLWSFAKIPGAPPSVMIAIITRMSQLLQTPAASSLLDVQALSNSIWAIAHVQARPTEMVNADGWEPAVATFLLLMANQCLSLLNSAIEQAPGRRMLLAPQGLDAEGRVSCQAIANIAWSFSSILGPACGEQDPVRTLFLTIRHQVIAKLTGTVHGKTTAGQALAGSFNEQALCNIVYAFDKAHLLTGELLQAVLDVACLRMGRSIGSPGQGGSPHGPLSFKPQELCTLLRACHLGIAQPWVFLQVLSRLLRLHPAALVNWNSAEQAELRRTLQLLKTHMPEQVNVASGLQTASGAMATLASGPGGSYTLVPAPLTSITQLQPAGPSSSLYHLSDPNMGARSVEQREWPQGLPLQQVWLQGADGQLQPVTLFVGHAPTHAANAALPMEELVQWGGPHHPRRS